MQSFKHVGVLPCSAALAPVVSALLPGNCNTVFGNVADTTEDDIHLGKLRLFVASRYMVF